MTDSASAYAEVECAGVVEKHKVNHSALEFARSVEVLKNVNTRAVEPGTAGTFVIDGEWRRLKEGIPDSLNRRTPAGRQRIKYYVHAQQWRRSHRLSDMWPIYCSVLHQWRSQGGVYWSGDKHEAAVGDEEPV